MQATGRLFLCARCRAQVFICRRCDRGNRYCNADCAQAARRENTRRRVTAINKAVAAALHTLHEPDATGPDANS
jgi:hypothetical protein